MAMPWDRPRRSPPRYALWALKSLWCARIPYRATCSSMPGARDFIQAVERDDYDLVVAVDVSDPALLKPLPITEPRFFLDRRSVNIDHHFSNLYYATLNHVDVEAASATEIVGRLFREELSLAYTADIASDLLYGVVNDTHSFQNTNTTPRTLRFSADLVEAGADLSAIVFNLLLEKRVSAARLWAETLPTLRFAEQERVAFLTVSLDALNRAGGTLEDADGLVEFLRNIQGVDLAVLFKQTSPDEYRLSLRTKLRGRRDRRRRYIRRWRTSTGVGRRRQRGPECDRTPYRGRLSRDSYAWRRVAHPG